MDHLRRLALAALVVTAQAGPLRAQSPLPPDGTVRGELAARIDQHLTRAARFGFAGAVVVAVRGEVVLHKGYGIADREQGRPVTANTVFDIGSITKPFTAAAILRLEELGRLRVTDTIGRFLPDVPRDKAGITLHHLLTHTAGLPGGFGDDYDPISRDSLVRVALAAPLRSAPGERFSYSNVGYSLLGAIIEIASERTYEQFLRDNVLAPAQANATGYRMVSFPSERLAVGYRDGARWGTPLDQAWAPDGPSWHLRSNGGLLSTVGDLYRWQRALSSGRVISAESYRKATSPGGDSYYAYGWEVGQTPTGTREIGHSGVNGYFFADLRHFPDDSMTFVFATNDAAQHIVEDDIVQLLSGQAVHEIPMAGRAAGRLQDYRGRYRTRSGAEFEIGTLGESLQIVGAPTDVTAAIRTDRSHALRTPAADSLMTGIIERMAAGDFTPYRERYWDNFGYPFDGETEFWTTVFGDWQRSDGEFRGARILGVAEIQHARGPMLATYVGLTYGRNEHVVRVLRPLAPGGTMFVATASSQQWPTSMVLAPRSATEFLTYDFMSGRSSMVSFVRDREGKVRTVTFPDGSQAEKL